MTTLQELHEQKAAIERQIAETQAASRKDSVARVKALMAELGLTVADLQARPANGKGVKAPIKFRDPDNKVHTWSGRGIKPKWLQAHLAAGRALSEFEAA